MAEHGGLYVPENERTPPNPYLDHVEDQNIQTPSGVNLTLMNPAYALRQLIEEYEASMGIIGHITSLNPINPDNAADEWETSALVAFEEGVEEVTALSEIDGVTYLRLMKPMFTQDSCLKCHGYQGYEVGDIRGGISISVPVTQFVQDESEIRSLNLRNHAILWCLGLLGIFLGTRQINKDMEEAVRAGARVLVQQAQILQEQELGRMKTQFISTATHEIRTPVTSILGYLELVLADSNHNLPELVIEDLNVVLRNANRLVTLTNDLLDVQRITSGRFEINREPVDLVNTLNEVVEELTPLFTEKNQVLVVEAPSELIVDLDEVRISQLLINLLRNANKFTPDEGQITVTLDSDDSHVQILFKDSGIGLSEVDMGKLFTPFPGINHGLDVSSTGLGLSIAKGIVELHGGEIWVESEGTGKGSIFHVRLPLNP